MWIFVVYVPRRQLCHSLRPGGLQCRLVGCSHLHIGQGKSPASFCHGLSSPAPAAVQFTPCCFGSEYQLHRIKPLAMWWDEREILLPASKVRH